MDRRRRRLPGLIAVLALCGCASSVRVLVSPGYREPPGGRRVAALALDDYPGSPGSGAVATAAFEKYLLLAGYTLVERRQADRLLAERSLNPADPLDPATLRRIGGALGVDAVVLGAVTGFSRPRGELRAMAMSVRETRPVYGRVVTTRRDGRNEIRTVEPMITGHQTRERDEIVPVETTVPADAGLSVRLVDVATGEVLWSAAAVAQGPDTASALEDASARLMRAVADRLQDVR